MSFHRLAPIVYRKTSGSQRNLKRTMAPLRSLGAGFWKRTNRQGARRFGTGQSGYANLAMYLQRHLGI
jgi:hypothetical protein